MYCKNTMSVVEHSIRYFHSYHDDVIKWKHFPRYWPFVRRIHRSPVNSPHKGQWRGALMFSLIWTWINNWVNNLEAGDLRRHRAHCDVSVIWHGLYFVNHFVHNLHLTTSQGSPDVRRPVYVVMIVTTQKEVVNWKRFPHFGPFVSRIHRSLVDSLHKVPVMMTFDVSLMLVGIKFWTNIRLPGNIGRHEAHVISPLSLLWMTWRQIGTRPSTTFLPTITVRILVNSTSIDPWNRFKSISDVLPLPSKPGHRLNIKTVFPRYGITMSKIRRSWDRLILNLGDPYTDKTLCLYWDGTQVSVRVQRKIFISSEWV